ncbi:hypothetical protein Tco_1291793 [Tanacetum coccineum]
MDLENVPNNSLCQNATLKQEEGNSFKPVARTTTNQDGTSTTTIPGAVTDEEKILKKNDLKARSILMRWTLPSLFTPPSIDLSNSRLAKFKEPEFEGYGVKVNKGASKNVSKEVKKTSDAPIIEIGFLDSDERSLATSGQTATGKESSNPFMAGSLPKTIKAKDSEVCKITRADGSSSFHGDFQALLRRLDRQDLSQLYSLELLRWKLHEDSGVHSLFLDGTSIQINMLVEKKYPLKKTILEKMINLKIEAEEDSNMAIELIKFIKSQIAEQS